MKFVPFTVRVKAAPPAVALEGDRVVREGTGLVPTPLKDTVCGLVGASLVTVIVVVRSPRAVGWNVTLKMQEPPAGTVAGRGMQVPVVIAKSPGERTTLVTISVSVPALLKVTCWAELTLPSL